MSKLIRILAVILIAFALSSLLLYRLRLGSPQSGSGGARSNNRIADETRIVEGQIQAFDTDTNTLTLINDNEELMLSFDERTAIIDAGRPVRPAAITLGTPAKVKYTQRAGKKWARRIELAHAEETDSVDSY